MAKPTYESLVKQGRQAAKSQWTLGDLASKVETNYGDAKLQEYADDIGVEYGSLRRYRDVSKAYETAKRIADVPWSIYLVLAAQEDRFDLVASNPPLTVAGARAMVRARKELGATPELPPIEEDTWLGQAFQKLRPVVEARTGLPVPEKARVSLGWPMQKSSGTDTIGQHWSGAKDAVPQIYISPQLGDATRVLDVLVHEMVHSALPAGTSHKKPFAEAASKVGLEGPAKETFAGPALKVVLADIADELGVYPHSPIDPPKKKTRTTTRETEPNTVKFACIDCVSVGGDGEGYYCTVTVPRSILEESGWPVVTCPIDGRQMELIAE